MRKYNEAREYIIYIQSGNVPKCIICNEEKYFEGRKIQVRTMTLRNKQDNVHKVEKSLLEFARLHKANNTRYADAAERILLTNSIKSLFVADVGFHEKECYEKFRSTHWKNKFEYKENKESQTDNSMIELLNLVEVHIINRHEVYTPAQLRKFYDEVKGNISSSSRSIAI